jgi:hypothetical protein
MIHYIGGAARCGKGILSRRLLSELGLPYLSLDVLKMGLSRGMPELAFDPDAGGMGVAERLLAGGARNEPEPDRRRGGLRV